MHLKYCWHIGRYVRNADIVPPLHGVSGVLNANIIVKPLLVCVFVCSFSSAAFAEVYKWVDKDGRVHYSDKKADAGQVNAEEVDVTLTPNRIPKVTSKLSAPGATTQKSANQPKKQETLAGNNKEEGVDPRCTLARNIISGRARLRNGLPTGPHEIEVAQRDIKKFCN